MRQASSTRSGDALGLWGAPRATKDVDISIFAATTPFDAVADALERAGVMLDRVSSHPQSESMRERGRSVAHSDGTMLSFLSPEDLCIVKLIYNGDKDTTDLERLFAVRQDLEIDYVRRWITDIVGVDDPRLMVLAKLERLLPDS